MKHKLLIKSVLIAIISGVALSAQAKKDKAFPYLPTLGLLGPKVSYYTTESVQTLASRDSDYLQRIKKRNFDTITSQGADLTLRAQSDNLGEGVCISEVDMKHTDKPGLKDSDSNKRYPPMSFCLTYVNLRNKENQVHQVFFSQQSRASSLAFKDMMLTAKESELTGACGYANRALKELWTIANQNNLWCD